MNVPRDGHDLSSLKAFVTGGSTVPVELIRRIEREIGVPVIEGYGMTEVHCYSTINPGARRAARRGRSAFACPIPRSGLPTSRRTAPSGAIARPARSVMS